MIFDVMLPYYGDVSLMQIAVRSVLAQTDPGWRLTVVDDGREPGVPEWFASIDDERVRYLRNEHNLGVTRNYQKCVSLVEREHFVMMGTDDVMLPNYISSIRSVLEEHPTVAMVQPGVEVINGAGKVTNTLADEVKRRFYAPKLSSSRVLMSGEPLATSLLRGNWLYFPSICWRSDAVKAVNFREHLAIIQDLALVIDLLERGESMVIDTEKCFQYRRHTISASSVTAVAGTRFIEAKNYFLDAADQMRRHGWTSAERAARRHLSSRMHAITLLPAAMKARHTSGLRNLAIHAFGTGRRVAE